MKYRSIIGFFAASIFLAGCNTAGSGPASSVPAYTSTESDAALLARGLNFVKSPEVKAQIGVIFETGSKVGPVLLYAMDGQKHSPPFCKINPEYPVLGGISGDSNGDLWLPESFGGYYIQSEIVEYKPNCGRPILTLQDPNASVTGVYVARDGEAYVANFENATRTPGNILIYRKGSSTPAESLGGPDRDYFIGVTANTKKHDVIATYSGCDESCSLGLLVFKHNEATGVPIEDSALFDPGIPTIDEGGVVLVPDRTTLRSYSFPYSKPGKTYTLKGDSYQCSLNKSQTDIACADYQNNTVDVYAYSSMKYSYSFSKGFDGSVEGIAQTPN